MRRTWTLTKPGSGLALGGTRRFGGWVVVPHLSIDLHQLQVGIYWQREDWEDPDPMLAFHLPGVVLWLRFYRILPGYRGKRRARRARLKAVSS